MEGISMTDTELLKYAVENGIIDTALIQKKIEMLKREEILKKHPYHIGQIADGRWKTYLPDETRKEGRRPIVKKDRKKLEDVLIEYYTGLEDQKYIEENIGNSIENTEDAEENTCTLRKLYVKWLVYKQSHTDSTTYIKRIISDWNRFYDHDEIADMKLTSLTTVFLDVWLHNVIKEYKLPRNAYYNMSIILRQSLEYACMDGVDILQKNPMDKVKINSKLFTRKPKPKSETQVFLRSEQKLVAEECSFRVNRNLECTTPLGILLNFQIGLRIGELVALKWSDIDGNYINICRMEVEDYEIVIDEATNSVKVIPKGYKIVEYTKSDAGMRTIFLNSEAKRLLEIIRSINDNCGYYSDNFILISSQRKERSNARTITTYLEKLCIAIGILNKSNHKIRKTFISSLFDNNVNIDTIRETAGHADERTSLNNYCFDQDDLEIQEKKLEECKNAITATFQIVS